MLLASHSRIPRMTRGSGNSKLAEEQAVAKQQKHAAEVPPAIITVEQMNFDYTVRGGDEHIRPVRVFDDGAKTYIQMPPELQHREAPVLLVVGKDGKGEMTNYRVKDQTYIVDRLFDRANLVLGSGKKAQKWRSAVDTNNKPNHQPLEATSGEVVKETAPSGIDLHPEPQKAVRISRRAGIMIVFLILLLMLAFAYGGYRRALDNQTAARDAGLPKSVTPATQAALGVHAGDSGGHGADDPATS